MHGTTNIKKLSNSCVIAQFNLVFVRIKHMQNKKNADTETLNQYTWSTNSTAIVPTGEHGKKLHCS
jgi:hypothetical protein